MSMKKVKAGSNMYQGWVSHTHAHLGGLCPHKCCYCYVENPRFGRNPNFDGPIRLLDKEFLVNYGHGKTIFVDHMNDLFAADVPEWMILKVLWHCKDWPDNTYVFQSKNPTRIASMLAHFPKKILIGTTIETNRPISKEISLAPDPFERAAAMAKIDAPKFVTVEPILDFDVDEFAAMLIGIRPSFINIGADSKNHDLPEPSKDKILALVEKIRNASIEIKKKLNLERLLK